MSKNIWKNKKVLVTGGDGMIGRELVEQLINLNCIVQVMDIKRNRETHDCTNFENCVNMLTYFKPDYVFHLAGIKGSPTKSKEYPVDYMEPMLRFNTNMISATEYARQIGYDIKGFLYTSSIAVEFPEFDFYSGWAKLTGERLIEAMRIQYPNSKYVIVRPANVYGRFDDYENTSIRSMVVPTLISNALKGNLELWGEGDTIRDFIYAKDVAKGMIKAMEEMPDYSVRLCSGEDVSIKQLTETISLYTKTEIKKIPLPKDAVLGDKRRVMEKNWDNPLDYNIEQGIKEIVEYLNDKK